MVCSCKCAVACLYPRNSITNVVASAIHDDKKIHFNETMMEGRANRSLYLGLGGETNRTLIVKVVHNKRG